ARRGPTSELARTVRVFEGSAIERPSRTQPSPSARPVHSSHTRCTADPSRNAAACSPRSNERVQISHTTGSWLVCSWRVAIASTLAQGQRWRPRTPARSDARRRLLGGAEHLGDEVAGNLLVAHELHRVVALAAGDRAQVRRA